MKKDIIATATKRANHGMIKEILSSKESLQLLINEFQQFTCLITIDGRILWGNLIASEWFDVAHDILYKSQLKTLFDEAGWNQIISALECFTKGNFENIEITSSSILRGERRDIAWSFRCVPSISQRRGMIIQAVGKDVTEILQTSTTKARLQAELETAQLIQQRFLPPNQLQQDGISIAAFYKPAEECSGDWWHYFSINEEQSLLCIADVMGHGTASALVTAMTHSSCVSFALECKKGKRTVNICDLMSHINSTVYETFRGEYLLTFVGIIIDRKTLKYQACNAGHNFPYTLSKDGVLKSVNGLHEPASADSVSLT